MCYPLAGQFNEFWQICNHYCYWDVEYYHNPKKFLHAPFPIFLQALGTTALNFFFLNLRLSFLNDTLWRLPTYHPPPCTAVSGLTLPLFSLFSHFLSCICSILHEFTCFSTTMNTLFSSKLCSRIREMFPFRQTTFGWWSSPSSVCQSPCVQRSWSLSPWNLKGSLFFP